MAFIQPDSTITLYQNVDIDNGEQLAFTSKANQEAYFNARKLTPITPCTMVKKTGAIRVELSGAIVSTCNYLSFVNPHFDNITIYARIMDYNYINNECTEITYAIDYWQTWMFDTNLTFHDCFIEREHESELAKSNQTDPYDLSVLEYRTGEQLPISKDLEKIDYSIGSDLTQNEGSKIAFGVHSLTPVTSELGVLIKMSNIDWETLDGPKNTAPGAYVNYKSWPFVQYLSAIVNKNYGFIYLSKETYDHIADYYAGATLPFNSRRACGSGWAVDGQPIYPFSNTTYTPPITYIYDPDACDSSNTTMDTFLTLMTQFSFVEGSGVSEGSIIDMTMIPNDVMILSGDVGGAHPLEVHQLTPREDLTNIECKKLMRYPFSYLRLIAPNGDVKELRYENFANVRNTQNGYPLLVATLDLTDKPSLIIAPKGYNYTGLTTSSDDANINEAMIFNQFPTMPYNIDAFTAQVAATANDVIASRTASAEFEMTRGDLANVQTAGKFDQMSSAIRRSISDVGKGASVGGEAGAAVGVGASILSLGNAYDQMKLNETEQKYRERLWQDVESALGSADGGEVAEQLKLTKMAYAADHYYPSNGVGAINYNYASFCDIIILRVQLSAEILSLYDNYFKEYGYTSGRCGMPRVLNFVKNGTTTGANAPAWYTVNGNETTYVKTMDAKVTHSMINVASYIKQMLDNGVRFINGDPTS